MAVDRASKQLQQAAGASAQKSALNEADERALLQAILCAYPDRVARRRSGDKNSQPEFALAGGGGATLSPMSVVRDTDLLVLVDVEERGNATVKGGGAMSKTLVRLASAIEADWLLDLPGSPVHETQEVLWNAQAERIEVVRRLQYEQLVLDESRAPGDGRDDAQRALLAQKVLAEKLRVFADGEELPRLSAKLELMARELPDSGVVPIDARRIEEAVRELCRDRGSFDDLRSLSITDALLAAQSVRGLKAELARLLPDHVTLGPSGRGRRVRVHYESGKPPWVESRLQDFFGMAEGPRVLHSRVAVVLHLLAPNQRAVQVTTDLAGFWTRHYAGIRKELCRRYPKHAWPEDPRVD
jgi:ATP-dependent helicase HrpB